MSDTNGHFSFAGLSYTSTDGLFTIEDLGKFPKVTWINAMTRVLDHVTGNESISKASTAKGKDPNITDEAYAKIVLDARTKLIGDMVAGLWGEKGNRSPRMPGATRLDQIVNNLLAEDTRKALNKAGYKPADEKGKWLTPEGNEFTFADAMKAYRENAEFGAGRMESINTRAKVKYDAEVAEAEQRKADREREAKVAKPTGEGLVL